MLKYPDPVRAGKFKNAISYKNNQFSEHIGCQIFKACGFKVQDTLLGYFTDKVTGKRKLVVACKDFTQYEYHGLVGSRCAFLFWLLFKLDTNNYNKYIAFIINLMYNYIKVRVKRAT